MGGAGSAHVRTRRKPLAVNYDNFVRGPSADGLWDRQISVSV